MSKEKTAHEAMARAAEGIKWLSSVLEKNAQASEQMGEAIDRWVKMGLAEQEASEIETRIKAPEQEVSEAKTEAKRL